MEAGRTFASRQHEQTWRSVTMTQCRVTPNSQDKLAKTKHLKEGLLLSHWFGYEKFEME